MSISSVTNPVGTLSTGHVVTAAEWNNVHDTLYNYLNNTVKVAIDALQAAPSPTVVAQGVCDARLTLATGDAVPQSDQTAKTTIYLTPYKGNQVGLYVSSAWGLYTLTEISIAVPSVKLQTYDVWVYDNSGTRTLEIDAWKTVTASNNPSAGSAVTISVSDTSGCSVGDVVTVRDGSNAEVAVVTTVTTNTSIVVDVLANSYTAPTIGYNTQAASAQRTLQDGVIVKSGATTRRYVGSFRTTGTAGQTEDSAARRFVWNHTQRVPRHMNTSSSGLDSTGSETTLGPIAANKTDGTGRVAFLIGSEGASIRGSIGCQAFATASLAVANFGLGLNSNSAITGDDMIAGGGTLTVGLVANMVAYRSTGVHFLQGLVLVTGGAAAQNARINATLDI